MSPLSTPYSRSGIRNCPDDGFSCSESECAVLSRRHHQRGGVEKRHMQSSLVADRTALVTYAHREVGEDKSLMLGAAGAARIQETHSQLSLSEVLP